MIRILAGSLLALTACGSSVSVIDDGGGGAEAAGGAGGVGGGDTCSPPALCNPASCPAEMPSKWWTDCSDEGLSCSYQDGECVVTYACKRGGSCDGEGSDECESGLFLRPVDETCDVESVPCDVAQEGDPCAVPGEICGGAYECETIYRECGEDREWHDDSTYDPCCDDPCPG